MIHSRLSYSDPPNMKSFLTSSIATVLLLPTVSSGQSFKKYIAGPYAQQGGAIDRTTDGGFIMAGQTRSFGAIGEDDLYLVRTDPNGNMMWTRTFGSNVNDLGVAVKQTHEGGFLTAGFSGNADASAGEAYLVRTDSNGDLLWSRTYGGFGFAAGYGLTITPDGGAILVGGAADYPTASNIFAVRTNDSGDTLWTRTYDLGAGDDIAFSVCMALGGGFLIAATKESVYFRMELLRINDDGNLIWNKEFNYSNWGEGRSVIATSDGGFMVAGSLNNDACLLKLDPAGTVQWAKTYPSTEGDYSVIYAAQQTMDGGYVVNGFHDYLDWWMKTDAVGDTLWQHFLPYSSSMANSVTETTNGSYALCSTDNASLVFLHSDMNGNIPCDQMTFPVEVQNVTPNEGNPAVSIGYLAGMGIPVTQQGSGGEFTTECESTGLAEVGTGPHYLISPNPANNRCTVSFGTSHYDALEVVTMQGAVVLRMHLDSQPQMEVPLDDLAQGPYLIHLTGPVPQYLHFLVAR